MKLTNNTKLKPGMTLIELTVVILVLLTLISVLFIGAQAYKNGSDNAACLLNLRNMQQAMRSEMNLSKHAPKTDGLAVKNVIGSGLFLEEAPVCPTDNATAYTGTDVTKYPALGTMWATCAQAERASFHNPDVADVKGW